MSATPYKLISLATTNGVNVLAARGVITNIHVNNLNAAARYLKLYDKATAPTVGTDVPVQTIELPPTGSQALVFPRGLKFDNGIGLSLNTGSADADTGAVGAGDHVVNIAYEPTG